MTGMPRSNSPTFTELTEGRSFPPMSGRTPVDLAAAGYVESEWAASGEATSFDVAATPGDGRFELTAADSAPYATRVLVRRPADPARFSGVVLVEWLNVSGGQDAAPDWTYLADEILRAGHVWIGVSAQYIGVAGGEAAVAMGGQTQGMRQASPQRYGDLQHPGDAYSYDIFTQVGRYAQDPVDADGEPTRPIGDLRPVTVIAVGESQSAYALTSYINGVHAGVNPGDGVFDAFLLHSRGAGFLRFDDRGRGADIRSSLGVGPARLREDVGVPVLVVQAEGDLTGLLAALPARQPDSEWITTWEIAGQAHADAFQLGRFTRFVDCQGPVNSGQQVFVLRAGLSHLITWAGGGARPPAAPPIEMDVDDNDDDNIGRPAAGSSASPDEFGNRRGGVRTPIVEAPVEHLTGDVHPEAPPMCMLLGRTVAVDDGVLRGRWRSREEYLAAYAEATDRLIAEGFLLAEDREDILADARPERITW